MSVAGSRRRAREAALQVLYQMDVDPQLAPEAALELYWEHVRRDGASLVESGEEDDTEVRPSAWMEPAQATLRDPPRGVVSPHVNADEDDEEGPDDTEVSPASSDAAEVQRYCIELVLGVHRYRAELDALIQQVSKNWRLERMARVDRNVLRLSTYELAHRPDVPARAALNEAIEIAKRFGTAESASFVNGILDKVSQQLGR